jgi:hypothetical protein
MKFAPGALLLAALLLSSPVVLAQDAPEETPTPAADVAAESVAEATAEPVADDAAEPVAEATAEPVADDAAEPVAEAAAEPEGEKTKTSAPVVSSAVPDSVAILTGAATGGSRKSRFGGIVILDQSLGLGTFVSDKYARNPYYGWALSLRPRYFFTDNFFAELRFDLSGELTQSYTSSNTYQRQVMPSDLFLTLKYQNAYKLPVLGVSISPSLRLGAPTSYESRYRNLYLSGALGLDLQRVFASRFVLAYAIRFNKNFNRTYTPTLSSTVALARFRGLEDAGGGEIINGVDNNISFSLTNSMSGTAIINPKWSLTLQIGIQNAWTYANIAKDEFSSPYAKGGRGQRDSTFGTLDVSYQAFEHVGFSLGVSSSQPAKTRDNKRFRFPFFDFSTEGNNFTNFYFDVYATF